MATTKGSNHALEQLRAHFAPQQRRRHDDRPALYTLASTGCLFLALALLALWAEPDLAAWRSGAAPVAGTPPPVAASCPGRS